MIFPVIAAPVKGDAWQRNMRGKRVIDVRQEGRVFAYKQALVYALVCLPGAV